MVSRVFAISDIHVGHHGNRPIVENIWPDSPEDWLIVAGDVGENPDVVEWALALLRSRYAKVIWVPGNHELWTDAMEPPEMRGVARYEYLVDMCRRLDVATPEDLYVVWHCESGPVTLVPMFLLYDYTFLPPGARTKAEALALAERREVVATDEVLLSPEPYATREAWCAARLSYTRRRLDELDPDMQLVLINHFPLVRAPTRRLFHQEFALWCGTEATADWHRIYNVRCAVYGHLHMPRTTYHDGVRFEEVSLGYPREWRKRFLRRRLPSEILPGP